MFDMQLLALGAVILFIVWITAGDDIHSFLDGFINLFCPVHRALRRTQAEVLSRNEYL